MKCVAIFFALLFTLGSSAQEALSSKVFIDDFNYFWNRIDAEYCYFDKKKTDWKKVKEIYGPMIDTVQGKLAFVNIMEDVINELYDHHCGLGINTRYSRKLVPTSTDVWAEFVNGRAVIPEVRRNSGGANCGIKAGMEVIAINDMPVSATIKKFLPKSLSASDVEAENFALRLALAGNRITERKYVLSNNGSHREYFPDAGGLTNSNFNYTPKLETKFIGRFGYIKINNCLFDNALIPAFDSAMLSMKNAGGLILDLRESPSGGNTTVGRAILGWFISKNHFFQKHEYTAEEKFYGVKRSWTEIVSPRKGKYFSKPLVILVNHWTGSVGEGITIGFDAFKRPNTMIIGTEMAGLNGAIYSQQMPNTRINFSYSAERLFHIDGKPRENYQPQLVLDSKALNNQEDPFIEAALRFLNSGK